MLERLRLFRNKNRKAGQDANAEQNVVLESEEKASEESTEQLYTNKKAKGGDKR